MPDTATATDDVVLVEFPREEAEALEEYLSGRIAENEAEQKTLDGEPLEDDEFSRIREWRDDIGRALRPEENPLRSRCPMILLVRTNPPESRVHLVRYGENNDAFGYSGYAIGSPYHEDELCPRLLAAIEPPERWSRWTSHGLNPYNLQAERWLEEKLTAEEE
jgi:hypothetical protein